MHGLTAWAPVLRRCWGMPWLQRPPPDALRRERVAAEEQRRLFGSEQPLLAGEELGFDVTSLTGALLMQHQFMVQGKVCSQATALRHVGWDQPGALFLAARIGSISASWLRACFVQQ